MKRMKDMLRRTLAVCLMTAVSMTMMVPVSADEDKPAAWAMDEVQEAIGNEVVPETLLSHFDAAITRVDFCTAVVHMVEAYTQMEAVEYIEMKGLKVPDESPFIDVVDQNVTFAYILGITSGYPDGTFKPYATITRQEAAKMLTNTMFALDRVTEADVQSYSDEEDISDWARPSIAVVDTFDIMNGVGDNRFDPRGTYQRQMAILTMNRLYNNLDSIPMNDNAPTDAYHYLIYGLGNAGDYTMTYGESSHKLYSTEYQKDGMYYAKQLTKNMYDEAFVLDVYVRDGKDYFVVPGLGKMVSYLNGSDATVLSEMYAAVNADYLAGRISNGAYLFTYGIPFIHDESMYTTYTFTMIDGDIVALETAFNGRVSTVTNIEFIFEPLDAAMFEVPQDLEHIEYNFEDDGEWAPFWWEVHSEDEL